MTLSSILSEKNVEDNILEEICASDNEFDTIFILFKPVPLSHSSSSDFLCNVRILTCEIAGEVLPEKSKASEQTYSSSCVSPTSSNNKFIADFGLGQSEG